MGGGNFADIDPETPGAAKGLKQLLMSSMKPVKQQNLKTPAAPVYQVIGVVADKQDVGFVDKVHVSERQISELCNHFVSCSSSSSVLPNPSNRIHFASLNNHSLQAIGLYGDKAMMLQFLTAMGLVDDKVRKEMHEGQLPAGLYAIPWLTEDALVLLYWHDAPQLEEASRKTVSCNFIRYIFDLCHQIFVCVDRVRFPKTSASSSSSDATGHVRKSRKPRAVRVEQVQIQDNDVVVVRRQDIDVQRTQQKQQQQNGQHKFHFTEGHYRCSFVTWFHKGQTAVTKDDAFVYSPGELRSRLENLSKAHTIDFSALKDEEFVGILEHCGFPEFQEYNELKNFQNRNPNKRSKPDAKAHIKAAECKIVEAFHDVLLEFCVWLKPFCSLPEEPVNECPFQRLQRQIVAACGVTDSNQRFIFVGSEFTFSSAEDDGTSFNFVVEPCKTRASGFVMFEDRIMVRSTETEASDDGIAYFRGSKPFLGSPVVSGEQVSLFLNDRIMVGLIENVDTPSHVIETWVEEFVPSWFQTLNEKLKFLCFLMNGGVSQLFQDLDAGLVEKFTVHFSRTFLSSKEGDFLLAILKSRGVESTARRFLSKVATVDFLTEADLNLVLQHLTNVSVAALSIRGRDEASSDGVQISWRQKLEAFRLNDCDFNRANSLMSCLSTRVVCDKAKELMQQQVVSHARKYLRTLIQDVRKAAEDAAERDRMQNAKERRKTFLSETKNKLFPGTEEPKQSRVVLKSCRAKKEWYGGSFKMNVTMGEEMVEEHMVQCMITEVAPKKKDLDALARNPMHTINLACSDSSGQMFCLNPDVQKVKKVVHLRSGEFIFLIHNRETGTLHVTFCPKHGRIQECAALKRGFNLVAFEETTRLLALYDSELAKVDIYKFEEGFRKCERTGLEIPLGNYRGSTNLLWMACVPGKHELLLVDDSNRVRVAELGYRSSNMLPKDISLPSDFVDGCISADGCFLFLLLRPTLSSAGQAGQTDISVYLLGGSMKFLKSISLDVSPDDLKMKMANYGGQNHIAFHSKANAHIISSYVLNMSCASEGLKFQNLSKEAEDLEPSDTSVLECCPELDFIYYIYEKFGVCPPLCGFGRQKKNLHLLMNQGGSCRGDDLFGKCREYLSWLITKVENDRGKSFKNYEFQFHTHNFQSLLGEGPQKPTEFNSEKQLLGNWIRNLICLVPIQICRADNNCIQPLLDGLGIASDVTYTDCVSLANLLRFGLYDAIIGQWDGKIKVVSSMGKQSSGKSYLMNHLSGSLLDVAGGRCTDGVWITVRMVSDCLYVLMDFEGLGSFERTEQEDMLLSVLNAAISNLTIFNKKDFHLDKETEAVFQRFQNGVNLVKEDEKLFNGMFYIAVKDVDSSDAIEIEEEFDKKIVHICNRSADNFVTKMYRGLYVIHLMPSFTRPEYYAEALLDIAEKVEELKQSYDSGCGFLRDLKLVIAQLAAKDWTPVDKKRTAMAIDVLRDKLEMAVKAGRPSSHERLENLQTLELIPDTPLKLWGRPMELPDTGLVLGPVDENTTEHDILDFLREHLNRKVKRSGSSGAAWHQKFQQFLEALADRRELRVQQWLLCNTTEISEDNEVRRLQREVKLMLAVLRQGLLICGCRCSKCFWICVLKKGHGLDHSCTGDHACKELCSFCKLESKSDQAINPDKCQGQAGHEGRHDCRKKRHTCGNRCEVPGCQKPCSFDVQHLGPHRCDAPRHECGNKCSLPGCSNPCILDMDMGKHKRHQCQETYCPARCMMPRCSRTCGDQDHFHQLSSSQHLCGLEHPCTHECQDPGICEIVTQMKREQRQFHGIRGSFDYEYVSEQRGLKRECCIVVPAYSKTHAGPHRHSEDPDDIHTCNARCLACGYFCQLPFGHVGLHDTAHGNMKNMNFVSEIREIDVEDRKYVWGESGVAEMCNMYCKARGRGHIHLAPCPEDSRSLDAGAGAGSSLSKCLRLSYDGARHQTRKYGPDFNRQKDELTHETYWQHMGFKDPCSEQERQEFGLCNHMCRSSDHSCSNDGSDGESFCTQKLWHEPVARSKRSSSRKQGHISRDGHVFDCNHVVDIPHHVIFVIDRSGSMASTDIKPTLSKFEQEHCCRLGLVYEAMAKFMEARINNANTEDVLSVVLFDDIAECAVELQDMGKENVVDDLLPYGPRGMTNFCEALKAAQQLLMRGRASPHYKTMMPVVIFMSDGGANQGGDPVQLVGSMIKADPRLVVHTIFYGTDPWMEILEKMAECGRGTFQQTIDEVQLTKSFESLAVSLRPPVAALM